jgi:hypothetical protein
VLFISKRRKRRREKALLRVEDKKELSNTTRSREKASEELKRFSL